MRWSWPSWAAIVLGLGVALYGFLQGDGSNPQLTAINSNAVLGGLILLGLGLFSLQRTYDACCDWGYGRCDCDHCAGCKRGDCCGECSCYDDDGDGHKGHKH